MKNLLFLFIAITSSFIFSQEVGPKIEFESLEINYGKISKGDNTEFVEATIEHLSLIHI